ncbi:DUF1996 domain-containing protein [Streptomyces ortus]|uniref:DUF1996 domain-containing protein n=1 Tax=Streptomyces ortus TaxID=2867268 RepID=A0ABT3VEY4_9ACTN|nr:DUF1996 domain-containing protein [Streptomyces ortus]MCX4238217.1 DUF1996 domain-containing protein [Streptomyces ortus]
MGRNTRRRPTGARRATIGAVALMLGGGGLVAANVYATASESTSGQTDQVLASGAATIDCPDVGSELAAVPDGSKTEVDKQLALLDKQIAEAYQRLQSSADAIKQDAAFAQNSIMNPLKDKRVATIERIVAAIDAVGDRPEGLDAFAPCILRASGNQDAPENGQDGEGNGDAQDGSAEDGAGQDGQDQGQDQGDGQEQGQGQEQGGDQGQGEQPPGNGGQAGNGPVAADFVDISTVKPNVSKPAAQGNASKGSFVTKCGVNENGLFNSDNVIVAPGVSNGAHHFHDYVGNQSNDAFASDEDLANAQTSCENQGDKSSYFWPVLRLQNGDDEKDAGSPGGGIEGNAGQIIRPKAATMSFEGSPRGDVTAMPKLLRIITGDAKAFVNGPTNANASWSCTGFEDRQLKDKYPLCPQGSDVVRTFRFQSCWDGRNIDSANHRTHVAFATADGSCANDFKAIPQLVQRIVYDVDAPSVADGGKSKPFFAVDSFPEQLHKPVTDHGDFINVFDEALMKEMVDCINDGRKCDGADDGGNGGGNGGGGNGGGGNGGGGNGGGGGGEEPTDPPATTPAPDPTEGNEQPGDDEPGDNGQGETPADNGGENTAKPSAGNTEATEAAGGADKGKNDEGKNDQGKGNAEPKAATSPSATQRDAGASTGDADTGAAVPGPEPSDAGGVAAPQAVTGGLAETGTSLWPAAAGGLLVIAGFVLLRRISSRSR